MFFIFFFFIAEERNLINITTKCSLLHICNNLTQLFAVLVKSRSHSLAFGLFQNIKIYEVSYKSTV